MSERTVNLGKRVELRQQRMRLANEAAALRQQIRMALPVDEDVAGIDSDTILSGAISLDQVLAELRGLDKRLAVLDRELGDAR
ncbi:hypothetical protein [Desulfovibrio aminophilus]|uniref:hypothetical protein n=1 Tax=Desulfovibrio aminophilus TaxID=81425 RepID=UPI0004128DA8|nr:hypothetical protein [Desulfovibrio aminophilus]